MKYIPDSGVQKNSFETDQWNKAKWEKKANPHVNSIQKRINQVIAKIVRTYDLQTII